MQIALNGQHVHKYSLFFIVKHQIENAIRQIYEFFVTEKTSFGAYLYTDEVFIRISEQFL
ncbi:MAG: hypothetical protein BHV70_04340 [Bacteroidales bacterium 55_9]|nr:MAG: hypothetical protein BHV70_04340 [Bacteroidales bacterium 55_9]